MGQGERRLLRGELTCSIGFGTGMGWATKGFNLPRAGEAAYAGQLPSRAIRDPNTTVEREIRLPAIIRLIRRTGA